jgi:hypothetical protein
MHERHECTRKCMTRKDIVNVIEGTRKYSAQVSDRWMTRVTNVPGGSRGARLTTVIRKGRSRVGGLVLLPHFMSISYLNCIIDTSRKQNLLLPGKNTALRTQYDSRIHGCTF